MPARQSQGRGRRSNPRSGRSAGRQARRQANAVSGKPYRPVKKQNGGKPANSSKGGMKNPFGVVGRARKGESR